MTLSDRPAAAVSAIRTEAHRMSLLGHDIRAAMSDIIGGLQLIPADRLGPETRVQVERVRAAGDSLALLIEDGLSAMLASDGQAAPGIAVVEVPRLLDDVGSRWKGRACEKGLTFAMSLGPEVPEFLALERLALDRIISNLLSNAMKFADRGTVRLDITMTAKGAVRMAVSDQGPGFSPEAMTRLFAAGGRPTGAEKPGQGLGMHITQDMARRLGGTIIVENPDGGGARVTLELPASCIRGNLAVRPPAPKGLPDLRGRSILLADDSPTCRAILRDMIVRMGATCTEAQDGEEACALLAHRSFDLAVIDVEMPRLCGLEVIRRMRQSGGRLPVLAVTAHALGASRDAILASGANAILAKPPTEIGTLGRAIAQLLAPHDGTDGAATGPTDPAPGLQHLLASVGPEMVAELLDRLSQDMRAAEQDLMSGLAERKSDRVRASSHVLIALAGTVGAEPLGRLMHELHGRAMADLKEPVDALGAEALAHLHRLASRIEAEKKRHGAT